ncbi:MAG TPA: ABC transporter ATP-binding protein [Geminicoccaceae bacterium]|nr:ABC transporter ATP-binding protein [Geminicoccaceae bacterium]
MAEPVLRVLGLARRFGGIVAADGVDLDLRAGEIHALIGPNGAGKTTLVNLITGELRPDRGQVVLGGQDVTRLAIERRRHLGLARSFQITSVFASFTALDNVAMAVQALDGHSFRFLAAAGADSRLNGPAREALAEVGLADAAATPAGELAHGERRQLEMAMGLGGRPHALLLDEPMAGMSAEESRRMVELLERLKGRYAVLLVEHDMDAVFRLADRISVLVYGRIIATGTGRAIRENPEVRQAYLGEDG